MERKSRVLCTLAAGAFGLGLSAQAETWYWYGGTAATSNPGWGGDISQAANWTNETHTAGSGTIPARGDTVIFNGGVKATTSNNVASKNPWGDITVGAGTKGFNQMFFCQVAGSKLYAEKAVFGTSGYYLYGTGESEIVSVNNLNLSFQKPFEAKEGTPTLVKNGTWKLTCYYQSGDRYYTIPHTRIRQGCLNLTTRKTNSGLRFYFDGDDASQGLEFTVSGHADDMRLKDSAIIETNGVANTGHYISAPYGAQLVLSGAPLVNPMVFSGTFKTQAGLTWTPSSSDYTFVFSNAVSSTSASVLVQKGTVKCVQGASFTNLAEVAVSAGAVFDVADVPSEPFKAATLTLADATARVRACTDATLTFTAATLNGVALAPGTYAATPGEGERAAAWLEGAGKVVVETGPANSGTWDGGDADSRAVTAAANWAGDAAPDLEAGDLLATFATGGTGAALPASATAKFAGLVLQNAFGASSFAFTADAGASAEIGASGISADKAATATAWNLGWPLALTADQTWTLGTNDTLNLTGGLSGTGALTFANAGLVHFAGVSTWSGALDLASGKYRVTATDGLGTSATVSYPHDLVNLAFGGTISVANAFSGTSFINVDAARAHALEIEADADVTFRKAVTFSSNGTLRYGANGKATFANGLKTTISAVHGTLYVCGAGGTLVVSNKPLSVARGLSVSGTNPFTLELHASGNQISGEEWGVVTKGTIRTHQANAFTSSGMLYLKNATLEFCGGAHALRNLMADAASGVTAADAATLTVTPNGDTANGGTNRVNKAVFAGPLSLVKSGTYPFALGAVSTATGGLTVAQGVLTLDTAAGWPNCTNVAVAAGATLKVRNANAFGDTDRGVRGKPVAAWNVTATSALNLNFSGTLRATTLRLDGAKIYGVYGAVGSGAEHEVAWITGAGRLRADAFGTALILR